MFYIFKHKCLYIPGVPTCRGKTFLWVGVLKLAIVDCDLVIQIKMTKSGALRSAKHSYNGIVKIVV